MDTEESSVSVSTIFTFLLLLSPIVSLEGQLHVVGSPQPIVAAPGDDVILPCHVEPKFNVVGLTVEWSRPDRNMEYVHLYRHNREMTDMKIPSYFGRTALFTDGLREGNISLRITNVTLEDEGRYRCSIPKLKSQTKSSFVSLIVGGLSRRSRLIPLVVFGVFILLCVAVAGLWFTESKRRKTEISCECSFIGALLLDTLDYLTEAKASPTLLGR
ncbi:myelin-oligodendrocyte glycoprotein-like isoform X2 [Pelmatolapia mariae]|uniref:myelin-oligodendrocyte glycoprotein-like isoform X2 n=1 Tax=Pelmatolapia mariae TaxID=158779 RepID=UPI002FE5F204